MPITPLIKGVVTSTGGSQYQTSTGAIIMTMDPVKKGISIVPANQNLNNTTGAGVIVHEIKLASSTTASPTQSVTLSQKVRIIEVVFHKTGAGSSGTTALTGQIQTSTGGAITDAANVKGVRGVIARAANIADNLGTIAAAASIKLARGGSIASTVAGHNTEITARVFCTRSS